MKISSDKYFILSNDNFNKDSMAIANAMAMELLPYGINVSRDLLREISHTTEDVAFKFCNSIVKDYTVGKLNRPLFTNWESRTSFTFGEIVVQIFGYMVQLSGNDLCDPSYMEKLLSQVNFTEQKTVSLAYANEAKNLFIDLVKSKVALDKKQLEVLVSLAKVFAGEIGAYQRIYSDEARISVVSALVDDGLDLYDTLTLLKCKPADALRYAVSFVDDIKLPSDVRYTSLTWKQRLGLLKFLNDFSYETLFEATGINRQAWVRFFKHIHLFQQKGFINKFKTIGFVSRVAVGSKEEVIPRQYYKILDEFLQEGVIESTETERLVFRTFASRVQSAIENKDFVKIEKLMEANGGYLLKNLTTVSNGIADDDFDKFRALVKSKLPTASVDILFSILGINVNARYRIIDIKGNTIVEEANYPRFITDIQYDIYAELHKRYGYLGKVNVDAELKDKVVPFLSKNADLDRGSKIKVSGSNYLYMFTHWIQNEQTRTDLDLSVVAFDKDWNSSTIYFGMQANAFIAHSGDITNAPAPNGATEYVRIDLDNIPENVKYIVPIINVFCGSVFSDNQLAYAGFHLSDSTYFSIEQEHTRYDLTQPANSNIPFVLDVDSGEIIMLDFNNRVRFGMTAHSEIENMQKLISASQDKNVITIEKLAEILSGDSDEEYLHITTVADTKGKIEPSNLSTLFNL